MLPEKPGTVYWILADIHEKTEINELRVSDHRACCDAMGKLGRCQLGLGETTAAVPQQTLSSKSFLRVLRVCSSEKPTIHKLPRFQLQLKKNAQTLT